jgi:DNA mismatch repair protein MutS
MQQHDAIKAEHPGCILFFRMGDFFELFGDDAVQAHRILGITLTRRNNGAAGEIPLCGFPHHQLERYVPKLIQAGLKVAVCEQLEDPKEAKGLVKRGVIEVITAGTAFNESTLDAKADALLAAVLPGRGRAHNSPTSPGAESLTALALMDITTGDFTVTQGTDDEIEAELCRRLPREILTLGSAEGIATGAAARLSRQEQIPLVVLEPSAFDPGAGEALLCRQFGVATLEPFGLADAPQLIGAAAAALSYALDLKRGSLSHLDRLRRRDLHDYMVLDPQTLRNLELLRPLHHEDERGTLLHILDHTSTAMGARLLRQWISHPLLNRPELEERHQALSALLENPVLADDLQHALREIADLERLMGRVGSGRANGRDLQSLGLSLVAAAHAGEVLRTCSDPLLRRCAPDSAALRRAGSHIVDLLAEELPLTLREGGLIRPGAAPELDALQQGIHDAREWLSSFEPRERERTGIPSLKVRFNRVFGYSIEISNTHSAKVPPEYIRKQTLANAERYITPEMKEVEARILNAEGGIFDLEYKIFCLLRERVATWNTQLRETAELLAQADCLLSLAFAARKHDLQRPVLRDDRLLEIRGAFHPVIVASNPEVEYIRNDVLLDPDQTQIMLITGPNMAGKSTYLRQTALVVLMAQIGSYVSAASATIGIVDRIFTRVGASDRLTRGQSTFMVEMVETASILHHAGPRSLILLDEIGRGTSTFDGLSLAWAIVETLHDDPRRAGKTLFATHYHEITALEESLPRLANFHVTVQEKNGELLFLRKVVPGACDSSYGIQVARMAGLPAEVVVRAQKILKWLEQKRVHPREMLTGASVPVQQDLFTAPVVPVEHELLVEEVRKCDPSQMTPIQALQFLDELRRLYLKA